MKHLIRAKSLFAIGAVLSGLLAVSTMTSTAAHAAQTLDRAVGLYVTPRGQQYFVDKFSELLFRNGYQFTQWQTPEWTYDMEETFTLSKLPASLHKYQGQLNEVRDLLHTWLVGFQLNDPKLSVTASNIRYDATFSTLSLRLDKDLTAKYGSSPRGAVFVMELVVPQINASIDKVLALDQNNKMFGSFGVSKVTVSLAKNSLPIRVQVPIFLHTDKQSGAQIEVLTPVTNIADIALSANLGPLIIPKNTGVVINGHMMPLDGRAIERSLLKYRPGLLKVLQHYLQNYAETSLASTLDDLIKKGLPDGIRENDTLDPPGSVKPKPAEKYSSILTFSSVSVTPDQSVYLSLDGLVSDPLARYETRLAPGVANSKEPTLGNSKDPGTYDVGISINQSLINRMIQLSYERGLFKSVKTDSGEVIHLTDRPRLVIDGKAGRDRIKLHLAVSEDASGFFNWFFVQSTIVVEFDLVARLEKTSSGTVCAVIDSIDEKSIYVDPKYIKMDTSMVLGKVRDAVQKKNAAFRAKPSNLIDKIPVPESIFGVPVKVSDYEANPNGFISLFLEYGE